MGLLNRAKPNGDGENKSGDDNKKVEKVIFVRKDTRPGIYTTNALGKTIKLDGRGVYETRNPAHIKFFMRDPEIVVFKEKAVKEKKEDK